MPSDLQGYPKPSTEIDPFPVGAVMIGPWDDIPDEFGGITSLRWKKAAGQLLKRVEFPEAYKACGTKYNTGGEAADEFRLPDPRSRTPMCSGQGSGLTNRTIGSKGGEEAHVLTTAELAAHSHGGGFFISSGGIIIGPPSNTTYGSASYGGSTTTQGSGTAHNTIGPFEVYLMIIKVKP